MVFNRIKAVPENIRNNNSINELFNVIIFLFKSNDYFVDKSESKCIIYQILVNICNLGD